MTTPEQVYRRVALELTLLLESCISSLLGGMSAILATTAGPLADCSPKTRSAPRLAT